MRHAADAGLSLLLWGVIGKTWVALNVMSSVDPTLAQHNRKQIDLAETSQLFWERYREGNL